MNPANASEILAYGSHHPDFLQDLSPLMAAVYRTLQAEHAQSTQAATPSPRVAAKSRHVTTATSTRHTGSVSKPTSDETGPTPTASQTAVGTHSRKEAAA